VGDVVEVRVYQEAELTGLYRVEAYGGFTFPLIGQIKATGLTPSELSQKLADQLKSGYLRNPQVTVFVKESHSKKIFILGKVKKPGTYSFEEGMSVVQAVAIAGGLLPIAARDLILIRTPEGEADAEERFLVPFKEISQGKAPNAPLRPGDILFIPESWL
jgi:polysaccharide export outer membrane protein